MLAVTVVIESMAVSCVTRCPCLLRGRGGVCEVSAIGTLGGGWVGTVYVGLCVGLSVGC